MSAKGRGRRSFSDADRETARRINLGQNVTSVINNLVKWGAIGFIAVEAVQGLAVLPTLRRGSRARRQTRRDALVPCVRRALPIRARSRARESRPVARAWPGNRLRCSPGAAS